MRLKDLAWCLLGTALLAALAGVFYFVLSLEPFDLIVINGDVIDGTGQSRITTDLGIRNGKIDYIGKLSGIIGFIRHVRSKRIIPADGLIVAPGFIDVHTHVEANLPAHSVFHAENFLRQGVTTIITGNCGHSRASIDKMFETLHRYGSDVNVATLIGHNSVRTLVMKADLERKSTSVEISEMAEVVKRAMHNGALGFSTGLAYFPGNYADRVEVVDLAIAAREASDSGAIYVTHIRDEASGEPAAIEEAIDIARRAQVPLQISHFKLSGKKQWNRADERMALINSARSAGIMITLDQYPYCSSSTTLDYLLPSSRLKEHTARLFREPETKKLIRAEMIDKLHLNGWSDFSFVRIASFIPDRSVEGFNIPVVLNRWAKETPRKIADLKGLNAAEQQAEVVIQMLRRGGAQMILDDMNEQDLKFIMNDSLTMCGTDSSVRTLGLGKPHPRGFGTFPRILGVYVREKGVLPLEEAIRRMTWLPATTFHLGKRGRIANGYWADLTIFDPDTIIDKAEYDNPFRYPEGISYVVVNGQVVLEGDTRTGANPGLPILRDGKEYIVRDSEQASAGSGNSHVKQESQTVTANPLN